jgi:hypothetical protein
VWIVQSGSLFLRVTVDSGTVGTPDAVTVADTFHAGSDERMGASIGPDPDGGWTARFLVPDLGFDLHGRYRLGDQELVPTNTTRADGTVEIVFGLDEAPAEEAVLDLWWQWDDQVVGFTRRVLPPGAFAAG